MPNRNTTLTCRLSRLVEEIFETCSTKYFFLFLTLFVFQFSFAATSSSNKQLDTIPSAKNHKLKKDQFYKIYGTDDSSRALIDYFFSKRKEGVIGTFVFIGGTVLAAVSI